MKPIHLSIRAASAAAKVLVKATLLFGVFVVFAPGSEPFACNSLPALAGEGGYTSMDIPHNTTWEIKGQ